MFCWYVVIELVLLVLFFPNFGKEPVTLKTADSELSSLAWTQRMERNAIVFLLLFFFLNSIF